MSLYFLMDDFPPDLCMGMIEHASQLGNGVGKSSGKKDEQ